MNRVSGIRIPLYGTEYLLVFRIRDNVCLDLRKARKTKMIATLSAASAKRLAAALTQYANEVKGSST